jgi:hypothetical protein
MSKHSKLSSKDKTPVGFWVGLEDLPADPIVLALAVEMCRRGHKLRRSSFEISIRQLSDRFSCSQDKIRNGFKLLSQLDLCSLKIEHQTKRVTEQNIERVNFGKVTTVTLHYALKGWNDQAGNQAGNQASNQDHININIISNINNNNKRSNINIREALSPDNEKVNPSSPNQLSLVPDSNLEQAQKSEPQNDTEEASVKQSSKSKIGVKLSIAAAKRICTQFNPLDLDDGADQLRYLMDEVNQYWQPKVIAIRNAAGDTFWEKHFIIMDRRKREDGKLWGTGDDGIKGYYKSYQVAERKKEELLAHISRLEQGGRL